MYNFSVVSLREKDLFWGVQPISGPFNCSGQWGGVMGSVINGDYPLSLSHWIFNIERFVVHCKLFHVLLCYEKDVFSEIFFQLCVTLMMISNLI